MATVPKLKATDRPPRPQAGFPDLIGDKLYKTGQTRGADDDEIYQNRVLRSNTVLIPLSCWRNGDIVPPGGFHRGYIVLIRPEDFFSEAPPTPRADLPTGLVLGNNCLV